MSKPTVLDACVVAALSEVARRRGGHAWQSSPLCWFDGFWDFVTIERPRIEHCVAWCVSGSDEHAPPWLLAHWCPSDGRGLRFDIFIESKDCRPGARAPWPVSSIYLHNGECVPPSTLPPRPCDAGLTAELAVLGYTTHYGYWGVHASCTNLSAVDAETLDRALSLAVALTTWQPLQRRD